MRVRIGASIGRAKALCLKDGPQLVFARSQRKTRLQSFRNFLTRLLPFQPIGGRDNSIDDWWLMQMRPTGGPKGCNTYNNDNNSYDARKHPQEPLHRIVPLWPIQNRGETTKSKN